MTESERFEAALNALREIGSAINRFEAGDSASAQGMVEMIVTGAAAAVPGVVVELFAYEQTADRLSADALAGSEPTAERASESLINADGLAEKAAKSRVRVLSYDQETGKAQDSVTTCFPLAAGAEVLGVLCAFRPGADHFAESDLILLENFSHMAAMALALSRQFLLAQQDQVRRERDLRRLRRAAMVISSRSNLKETLDAILEVALDITDAIYGVFRLVDRGGKNLVCMAITGAGLEQPAVETLPIDGASIMATVASRREPIVVSDLREEPWRHIYYPLDPTLEMRSEVAVPLIGASGRLEGVLNLESPQIGAFDRQDRYILQTLASQAVVAIQEARLLDALQEISLLLPRLSRQMVFQKLVEQACDLLNVPSGMIWLLEKDVLVCGASSEPDLIGLRIDHQAGLSGQALAQARAVTVNPASASNPTDTNYPDLPAFKGEGAALCIPLFANPDGKPLGSFSVHTTQADGRNFDQSDWDKKVLEILGHYAALAVQLSEQQDALRAAQIQRAHTEAFAAIGDIAANLLHRLNNKIGTIPVRIEGIQDKSADLLQREPYLSKNLEAIQRSASEAMEIVHESLFHLHPVQLAPVSIAASARQAAASNKPPDGVNVRLDDLEKLPPVLADSTRLSLVFHNLLENASDAMDGRGQISISGSVEEDCVLVSVVDDGPGIPLENQERIFEFNYSARASVQPGRLGFGLWWVKSLMARFGGSVSVSSDGQHGTAFILTFPRALDGSTGDETGEHNHAD